MSKKQAVLKQATLPVVFTPDIPARAFFFFRVCNSALNNFFKPSFYQLKYEILEQYGKQVGYDYQRLEQQCYSCNGTGIFRTGERCHDCIKGVYAVRGVALSRYRLNEQIFHVPLGRTDMNARIIDGAMAGQLPFYASVIDGYIRHKPYSLNATFAYFCLLSELRPERLPGAAKSYGEALMTNTKKRFKECLYEEQGLIDGLASFFKIDQTQLNYE